MKINIANTIRVKDLKEILSNFNDNDEIVIFDRHNDEINYIKQLTDEIHNGKVVLIDQSIEEFNTWCNAKAYVDKLNIR